MRGNPRAPRTLSMLKRIPPLLTPDALHALASMGHGDTLAIVDAHFPAARLAQRLVRLPGADAPAVLRAVLALLPLDAPGPSAWTMRVIGDPSAVPAAVAELQAVLSAAGEGRAEALDRSAFYERAAQSFAVFACGEQRTYGNLLLCKGVWREATP